MRERPRPSSRVRGFLARVQTQIYFRRLCDRVDYGRAPLQAFVPAAKLLPDEKLLSIDGATLQVTAVTPRATPSAVYNLEIQGEHAYAVSDAGVVVHNNQPYLKSANAIDDVGEVALDPYMKRLSDWAKSPANPANGKTVTSSSGIPNRLLRRQPGADHVAGGYVVDWKIIDGLFYSADGSTLIHFGKNYRGASEGIDFVIGMDGQLRLGSRHTYLAALGGDASHALAAGTLRISRGKITSITNISGHFNPTVSEAKQFPEVFSWTAPLLRHSLPFLGWMCLISSGSIPIANSLAFLVLVCDLVA